MLHVTMIVLFLLIGLCTLRIITYVFNLNSLLTLISNMDIRRRVVDTTITQQVQNALLDRSEWGLFWLPAAVFMTGNIIVLWWLFFNDASITDGYSTTSAFVFSAVIVRSFTMNFQPKWLTQLFKNVSVASDQVELETMTKKIEMLRQRMLETEQNNIQLPEEEITSIKTEIQAAIDRAQKIKLRNEELFKTDIK